MLIEGISPVDRSVNRASRAAQLAQYTDDQLTRLHDRVYDRMTRGDGYQPWGYDRPTLAITKPGWLEVLDAINAEWTRRNQTELNQQLDAMLGV